MKTESTKCDASRNLSSTTEQQCFTHAVNRGNNTAYCCRTWQRDMQNSQKKQRAKNFVPAISRRPSHPLLRGCSPRFSAALPLNRRRHSARGQSQVVAKLFCIAHWENCRHKIHTILRTNPTYPVYCVWTSATASAGWLLLLLPVALCGTEVAFRGCCALCGTGPSEEIPQPSPGLRVLIRTWHQCIRLINHV